MIYIIASVLLNILLFPVFNTVVFIESSLHKTFSKPHIAISNQTNHAPVVKIETPANKSSYAWNTTVSYSISVSDKEDGESQYQEISPNEVFLQVNYVPAATASVKQIVKADPPGLTVLKTSNCFNCHTVHTKSIGPSFSEISKRYTFSKPHIDLLAKRITNGSTGVWGATAMPSHPELSNEKVQQVVQWILKNGAQPDLNIYRGVEGSFRLAPPATKQKGSYVLTASYIDHGLPDHPEQRLKGQAV